VVGRTLLARTLVAAGVVLAFVGILAIYVRTTALEPSEGRSIARQLIAQPGIRAEVATASVDELYAKVDVAGLLRKQLPKSDGGFSAPISAGLRDVAVRAVQQMLQQPSVQDLWVSSVYEAHKQAVSILENKNEAVTASNGTAVLNLRPFVVRASERIGIGVKLAQSLPPDAGRITILHSGQLKTAQRAARWLNAVADWFWVLAIAAWGAALWIRPRDRRRELAEIAVGMILVGIALLIERAIAGHYIVDALIKNDTARPAGHSAWAIVTARLADSAWTAIGVGAVGLFGLWLQAGRRSRSIRAALAPAFRSLELAYGLLAALLLALFWWGPTVETRELRGLALIIPASIVGFELLRRSTVREFPDAQRGELWRTFRAGFASPAAGPVDVVERLERLARLHESGALSDEEFLAAKHTVLSG
jgi:putative oligomerization/nucleic acid binding protein